MCTCKFPLYFLHRRREILWVLYFLFFCPLILFILPFLLPLFFSYGLLKLAKFYDCTWILHSIINQYNKSIWKIIFCVLSIIAGVFIAFTTCYRDYYGKRNKRKEEKYYICDKGNSNNGYLIIYLMTFQYL